MTNPNPVIEGVFAIHKPSAISSAQVLRDLQSHLNPSKTFAPWITAERNRREEESHNQKQKRGRRSRGPVQVKMGHGGTLDPMATGVLIVGVGSGTKSLQGFLDGTKSYEAVLVFGAATDTYDAEGKIVKRAGYNHITRAAFEDALNKYRGSIMQKPPIFSALRVQGKRMYEYARAGEELPIEIAERPVEVSELECVEWLEPGTHTYNFPEREAEQEEKDIANKLMPIEEQESEVKPTSDADVDQGLKRKREEDTDANADGQTSVDAPASPKKTKQEEGAEQDAAAVTTNDSATVTDEQPKPAQVAAPEEDKPITQEPKYCPAPAARIRMTVSSGFYVRSLCHDLGASVGSLAFMAELARTRQSMFELGKNVIEYDDLAKGEDVWGPKIVGSLEQWNKDYPNGYERQGGQPSKRKIKIRPQREEFQRRRNSSSPEE